MLETVQQREYITEYGMIYFDFTKLPEANGATITTVEDRMNNFDGAGVNSPTCEVITFDGQTIKSYKDETNKCFNLNTTGSTLFNKSFDMWVIMSSTDGIQASGISLFGSRGSDTNRQLSWFISVSGVLGCVFGYTGDRLNYVHTTPTLKNGSQEIVMLRLRMNFEGDVVRMWKNQEELTLADVIGEVITGIDPALYDNPANLHVGSINANGTLTSNTSPSNFYKFLAAEKQDNISGQMIENRLIKDMLDHYTSWQNDLGVTTANIASKRAAMITYLFNGAGLPATATPASTNTSYTGLMHGVNTSSLVGAGTVTQIIWNILDGDSETWGYRQYRIPLASGSTNKWMIVHRGHGSEGAAASLTIINRALAEGYDVMWMAMPLADPDTEGQNTTTNAAAVSGHENLYNEGIDTASYNALELFVASQVRAINWLIANNTVSSLFSIGLSGGAYSVSLLGAIDTRVQKTIAVRGFRPKSSKWYPFIPSTFIGDFEQSNANGSTANNGPRVAQFWTDHPELEVMAMCTDGGRMYGTITHTNDSSFFGGYTYLAWKAALITKCVDLGGRYFQFINTTSGESLHSYQPAELTRAFTEFAI